MKKPQPLGAIGMLSILVSIILVVTLNSPIPSIGLVIGTGMLYISNKKYTRIRRDLGLP